jgi:hypothetical protein
VHDSNAWVDPFGLDIITVYRFDTRSPAQIKAGDGFNAKVPNANTDLLDYAANNTPSEYISTTYDINSAVDFGNAYYGKNGYLYKIEIDDSKGINVNEVLGFDSSYPWEIEFAVANQIPKDNIKVHAHAKDITDINHVRWICH